MIYQVLRLNGEDAEIVYTAASQRLCEDWINSQRGDNECRSWEDVYFGRHARFYQIAAATYVVPDPTTHIG